MHSNLQMLAIIMVLYLVIDTNWLALVILQLKNDSRLEEGKAKIKLSDTINGRSLRLQNSEDLLIILQLLLSRLLIIGVSTQSIYRDVMLALRFTGTFLTRAMSIGRGLEFCII